MANKMKNLTTTVQEEESGYGIHSRVSNKESSRSISLMTIVPKSLREVSSSERRKEASRPLYLIRYE